jgi:hypothetical protein
MIRCLVWLSYNTFDVISSLLASLDGFLFFYSPAIYPNALFGAHHLAYLMFSFYGVVDPRTTTCLHFYVDHLLEYLSLLIHVLSDANLGNRFYMNM